MSGIIRKLLASAVGYTPVGANVTPTDLQTAGRWRPMPQDKGAKGDGATNDTTAFTNFEAENAGRVVDLLGKTYVVNAVPTKNAYHNGVFNVGGVTQAAQLFNTFAGARPKFKAFGGQMRALMKSLANPLEQQTTIGLLGDSITWGEMLPENATSTPRNGTLADPRDNYAANSWANQLKRYIGATFFDNVAPTLSNWSYSSAGQSTATFTRTERLYTNLPPFTAPALTGSASSSDTNTSAALLGYRHMCGVANNTSFVDITFPFTGNAFNLVFTSINGQSADYEIDVNGTSIGQFASYTGVTANQQRRTHTLSSYVRNATIRIRAMWPAAGGTGTQYLMLEALEIIKTCSIVTQGVIGIDARAYVAYNFGAFGPSVVTPDMNYAFVQLGTNDRVNTYPNYSQPNGINNFKRNMNALLAALTPTCAVILMNANPVANESTATYSFDMQDVRNAVSQLGSDNALDVIDNYAPFLGFDNGTYTADGTHPNLLGHAMIARNIINSLEAA